MSKHFEVYGDQYKTSTKPLKSWLPKVNTYSMVNKNDRNSDLKLVLKILEMSNQPLLTLPPGVKTGKNR